MDYLNICQYLWTNKWLDCELGWVHPTLTDKGEYIGIEEAEAIQRYLDSQEECKMTDAVNPTHYKETYPFEVIDLIQNQLSTEQFIGYCLGNELKYRMRAGIKDSSKVEEDIAKAEWYRNARLAAYREG